MPVNAFRNWKTCCWWTCLKLYGPLKLAWFFLR
nr:MAG TPA: hypothetical protein [Caudoviricetes sp.]